MNIVFSPEAMASVYWNRMRKGALKEVEVKLTNFRGASPNTIRYWLAVHSWLENRAGVTAKKAFHEIVN